MYKYKGMSAVSHGIIYLDANATTSVPPDVIAEMVKWTNKGNPSADYASAREIKTMMTNFRKYIAKLCNFELSEGEKGCTTNMNAYRVIFTSGASESNTMIIRSVVDSYIANNEDIPHIIISAVEHRSIIDCACLMRQLKLADITEVLPNKMGFVEPASIEAHIRPNTCLISVMHANNETGCINNVKEIGQIAHKHKVPFHTDMVQSFGKFPLDLPANNIDAATICFHKLYAPKGVGALIIREPFLCGYKLQAFVCGTQNYGLRGGTENVSGIGAAFRATNMTMKNRAEKNAHMEKLRRRLITSLQDCLPCKTLFEYLENAGNKKQHEMELVFISMTNSTSAMKYLPNTILLSIVRRAPPVICNGEIKKMLEEKNIIVSIGSACNTADKLASHVARAMKFDDNLKRGILRISMQDDILVDHIDVFVADFIQTIKEFLAKNKT